MTEEQTKLDIETKKYASATLVALFVYLDKYKKMLWGSGWLFTLGYSDFFNWFGEFFGQYESFEYMASLVLMLIFSWFVWPYILGSTLKGSL
ncbi:MAG: hypothetical protein D3914_00735 [Candidatus Electrothrix sp. LOE2]|nr:hypothetical protein [Candidatus Electrothrix sp. LOE2]